MLICDTLEVQVVLVTTLVTTFLFVITFFVSCKTQTEIDFMACYNFFVVALLQRFVGSCLCYFGLRFVDTLESVLSVLQLCYNHFFLL